MKIINVPARAIRFIPLIKFIHSERGRSEQADIGGARSAGTGVYTEFTAMRPRMPSTARPRCRFAQQTYVAMYSVV